MSAKPNELVITDYIPNSYTFPSMAAPLDIKTMEYYINEGVNRIGIYDNKCFTITINSLVYGILFVELGKVYNSVSTTDTTEWFKQYSSKEVFKDWYHNPLKYELIYVPILNQGSTSCYDPTKREGFTVADIDTW